MTAYSQNVAQRNLAISGMLQSYSDSRTATRRNLQTLESEVYHSARDGADLIDRIRVNQVAEFAEQTFRALAQADRAPHYIHQYMQATILNYAELSQEGQLELENVVVELQRVENLFLYRSAYRNSIYTSIESLGSHRVILANLKWCLEKYRQPGAIRTFLLGLLYDAVVLDPNIFRNINLLTYSCMQQEVSIWIREYLNVLSASRQIEAAAIQQEGGIVQIDAEIFQPQPGNNMAEEVERQLGPLFDRWYKLSELECALLKELSQCQQKIVDMLVGSSPQSEFVELCRENFGILQNRYDQFLEIKQQCMQDIIAQYKQLIEAKLADPQEQVLAQQALSYHNTLPGIRDQLVHRTVYVRIMARLRDWDRAFNVQHSDILIQWIDILKKIVTPIIGKLSSQHELNTYFVNKLNACQDYIKEVLPRDHASDNKQISIDERRLLEVPVQLDEKVKGLTLALQERNDVGGVHRACSELLELLQSMQQANSSAFTPEGALSVLYSGVDELKEWLNSNVQELIQTTRQIQEYVLQMEGAELDRAILYYIDQCRCYKQLVQTVRESVLGEEETRPHVTEEKVNELAVSLENLQMQGQNVLWRSVEKLQSIVHTSQTILQAGMHS